MMSRVRTGAATLAAAMFVAAFVAWCSSTSTKYRRMTGIDRCTAMPVYAGPAGPFVGYVPVGVISSNECHWTSPNLLPNGKWQVTPLEYGLDVRLWHRPFDGWSAHHGWFTIGDAI
jgi:hypothetical protein